VASGGHANASSISQQAFEADSGAEVPEAKAPVRRDRFRDGSQGSGAGGGVKERP